MTAKLTPLTAVAAAIAASVLAGGVALAAPPPARSANAEGPAPRRALARADANRDGVLTKQEMLAAATRKFEKLDANRDGKLDAREMAGGRHGRGGGDRRGARDDYGDDDGR